MSEPIKIGDLVMVIRSCCTHRVRPTIFAVGKISRSHLAGWGRGFCSDCNAVFPEEDCAYGIGAKDIGQPLSWLKRIPPLSELEGQKTAEKSHG